MITLTLTLAQLEGLLPLLYANDYASNPILVHGGGGWKDSQLSWPLVLDDPLDSTKLIMLFHGMAAPTATGKNQMGRAWAYKSEPKIWYENSNPVLLNGTTGTFDAWTIFPNAAIYDNGTIWVFYTSAISNPGVLSTAVASSTDNGFTWTKHGVIVTAQSGWTSIGEPAAWKEGSTWYMLLCPRKETPTINVLPGMLLFTASSPTGPWTNTGTWAIERGSTYDSVYIEWGCVYKTADNYYVLIYCGYDGTDWTNNLAYSTSPTASNWTKSSKNPIQVKGQAGSWYERYVSTLFFHEVNNVLYGYFQGTNNQVDDYNHHTWDLGVNVAQSVATGTYAVSSAGTAEPPTTTTITLSWDAVAYYEDGSPVNPSDIAGYTIYLGTESLIYTTTIPVGNVLTSAITGLVPDTIYYMAVSCTTNGGVESALSDEVYSIPGGTVVAAFGEAATASSGTATTISDVNISSTGTGATASGGDATTQVTNDSDATVGVTGSGATATGGDASGIGDATVDTYGDFMSAVGGDSVASGTSGDGTAYATGTAAIADGGYSGAEGRGAGLMIWYQGMVLTARDSQGRLLTPRIM